MRLFALCRLSLGRGACCNPGYMDTNVNCNCVAFKRCNLYCSQLEIRTNRGFYKLILVSTNRRRSAGLCFAIAAYFFVEIAIIYGLVIFGCVEGFNKGRGRLKI